MRRRHRMSFGAEVLEIGETRFALWAPAAETVDLVLEDDARPMHREQDGTFALTTEAAPGTRYRLDGGEEVPDPASRYQPEDVHGASQLVDPEAFVWRDDGWKGRPWEETTLYELHVGSFSPEGTYAGVRERLDYLADLGPEPLDGFERPPGELLYAGEGATGDGSELPAWSVAWYLKGAG